MADSSNIKWHCKPFESLSAKELYNILNIRAEVFIVEQNCVYQDADGKDLKAWHLYAHENNRVLAYSRIFPPGAVYAEASIGRVATRLDQRGKGLGKTLILKSMDFIKKEFDHPPVRISAQTYLLNFYMDFGFKPEGEEYIEDHLPHIQMVFAG